MGTSNIARHRHTGVTTFVCVAACCLMLLSGCGGATHIDSSAGTATGASSSATAQDGTVFTGPYAQQIKRTYDNAHQSLTKKILKDSKITDQEFLELSQHFSDCAQQQNVEVTVDSQGGMSTSYPSGMSEADGDAIVKQCDADNDFTDMNMLRGDMSSNPNNEDPVVPLLKCLKQYGLAEQSMTVEDYKAIVSDESRTGTCLASISMNQYPGTMLQRRNSTLRAKQKPEVLHHRSPAGGLCESGFCREQVTYTSDTLVSYVWNRRICRKCSDRVRQAFGGVSPRTSAIGIPRI